MTTPVSVEVLKSFVIVLNFRNIEVSHEIQRWLKVAETIEVPNFVTSLTITHPMRSRSSRIVEIYYAGFSVARTVFGQLVSHENPSKVWNVQRASVL